MKKWGRPKQEQNESRFMGHQIADEVKMTTDRGFFKQRNPLGLIQRHIQSEFNKPLFFPPSSRLFLLNKSAGLDPPSYRLAAFRRGCDKLCRCARSQIHKSAIGLNSGDESKTVLERYQVIVIFKKQKTMSWRRFHFQCDVSKE